MNSRGRYPRLLDAEVGVELHSADPGPVVYEDDVQVVVAPIVRKQGTGESQFLFSFQSVQLRPATPNDSVIVFNVIEGCGPTVRNMFAVTLGMILRRVEGLISSCVDSGCRIVNSGTVAADCCSSKRKPIERPRAESV